jgi:hypothetical protein
MVCPTDVDNRTRTNYVIGISEGYSLQSDPDDVIKSAGGNWNNDSLTDQTDFTNNVKDGVAGGLGWTGGYDNSTDPDYIISSQGGNYRDNLLIPSNVKLAIEYGIDETGTYDPTGSLPDVPTLSFADQKDISGGDATATNQFYYMLESGNSWITGGSRTGNGTIDQGITIIGNYWGTLKSTITSGSVCTQAQKFWVSEGTVSQPARASLKARLRDRVAAKHYMICTKTGVTVYDMHQDRCNCYI